MRIATLQHPTYWQAVTARDATLDGAFVYAVETTGIYCRPSCPSRKPKPEHVSFFERPDLARRAGYRACRRCRPDQALAPTLEKITEVCRYIIAHADETLTLQQLGNRAGMSAAHLQRTFKRKVGVSPKQFQAACRSDAFRTALQEGEDIAAALYSAGYGSASRIYGNAKATLGMTPKTYQTKGRDTAIHYALSESPLGMVAVAATAQGVCAVRLGDDAEELERELREEFARATLQRDDEELAAYLETIMSHLNGRTPHLDLPLDVRATAFQKQVWQALQAIPYGETRSYGEVATAIGKPSAVRAVARACASNPVALAVPCHRVVRADGNLSGYRWGVERKEKLLAAEQERVTSNEI